VTTDRPEPDRSPRDLTPSLVPKLRAGDAGAGDLLDREYRERLVGFFWSRLGSHEEAEDAVQEVFRKVLESKQVPDNPRPWIYKIALNHCRNVLRGRARRRDNAALPSASRMSRGSTGVSTRFARDEAKSRLSHLVNALPVKYREVLRLRYADDLSRAEIAEVLEISESVVKSRLFEGLKKLREHASLLEDR